MRSAIPTIDTVEGSDRGLAAAERELSWPAGSVPVYVLSLARAVERRAAIEGHLTRLGVRYEILDGVDGRALADDEVRALVVPDIGLSRGMIGCNLSHLAAYRRLLAGPCDVALILEDDARLAPGVAELLKTVPDARQFDICLLDCLNRNRHGPVFRDADDRLDLGAGYVAFRLSSGPQTLHAYLISRAGAERRVAELLPMREAIDSYTWVNPPLRFYAVVGQMAAWVSEQSLDSMTSKGGRLNNPKLRSLRRHRWFHELSDWVKLKRPRQMLLARLMRAEYLIDPRRRWEAMPTGRPVVFDD